MKPVHVEMLEFAAALRGSYTRLGRVSRDSETNEYHFHTERGTVVGYGITLGEARRAIGNDPAALAW